MGFYEFARDKIFGKNFDGTFPLWFVNLKRESFVCKYMYIYFSFFDVYRKAVLCGMSSGALAQFIASPTDLVKVQMQMEGKRRLDGLPQR